MKFLIYIQLPEKILSFKFNRGRERKECVCMCMCICSSVIKQWKNSIQYTIVDP